jgi:hypothetical protein
MSCNPCKQEIKMFGPHFRWEYGLLALWGDKCWAKVVDPLLRVVVGQDDITSLQRIRASIQLTLLVAVALLPIAPFYNTAHMLTASGLLFDIAGALRLFLLEEIDYQIAGFTPNEHGNYPSVAMRELIMPEGVSVREINDRHISFFYYKKRGVLFLFFGFVLQMLGDLF